jgi:hypothetical protein
MIQTSNNATGAENMSSNQVAQTTLQQLGGNRFIIMTGAQCVADANSLIVKLPRSLIVTVELTGDDLYTVRTGRRSSLKQVFEGKPAVTWKREAVGVYADKLQATFTEHTGLHTHL